jgi:hypothetical protein
VCLIICKLTCSYGVLFVGLQALNWISTLPGTHHWHSSWCAKTGATLWESFKIGKPIYILPTNLVCFEYLSYLQISLHKLCVSQGMMIIMTTLMNQHTLIFNKLSSTCKFWFSNSGSIKALESTKWVENEHGRFDKKNL